MRTHLHRSILLVFVCALLVAAGCSSDNGSATSATSTTGTSSGRFTVLVVDECSGADLDATGVYSAPDGGPFDTPDVGLVGFTLGSSTPVGSTAVLRFADDRSFIERFATQIVPDNRKILFVFGAVPDTTYRWVLTVISPDGQVSAAIFGGELSVGTEDQACDLNSLGVTSSTVATP